MGKKVISFSLFGKHPTYTMGAVANARHANRAYPGWVCRFYVADGVPQSIVSRLQGYGAEVINMGPYFGYEGTLWRFFAMVDPEVDVALSRDTDSRFTTCELLMVNEWLASGKKYHVMCQGGYHFPIMAGLWGVRGNIPNFKELIENHQRSGSRETDERFLRDNLYPKIKGKVFVHRLSRRWMKRKFFIEEPVHPFPPIAKDKRGKYLDGPLMPVGLEMSPRRIFIAFSIYKRTIFSEFLLTLWLGTMGKTNIFRGRNMNLRFYVADNISPSLTERLRRYGRVVLKPAKTVYDDDPQYWKLMILSEKNLGAAVIGDFWQTFFLAIRTRIENGQINLYELLPIEYGSPSGFKSGFKRVSILSFCGPIAPVSDIENLVAQRDPNEIYREFIRSTVYPRTSTTRMTAVLRIHIRLLKHWARLLFPSWLYAVGVRVRKYLIAQIRRWRQDA